MACDCATCKVVEEVQRSTAARVGEIVLAALFTATPGQLRKGLEEADRIYKSAPDDERKKQAHYTLTVTRHLINMRDRLGALNVEHGLRVPDDLGPRQTEPPEWSPHPWELYEWLIGGPRSAERK